MPYRRTYRNGESINLTSNGCDGCSPMMVNGVLCHERGCPDAWRDTKAECPNCGKEFYPNDKGQTCCDDVCSAQYYGYDFFSPDFEGDDDG